jgi:ATP synthase protein I
LVSRTGDEFWPVEPAIVRSTIGVAGHARVCPYNLQALLDSSVTSSTSARNPRSASWADDDGQAEFTTLTREQARDLVGRSTRRVSPWWVIAVQAGVGLVAASLAWLWGQGGAAQGWFSSALYGAAVVVVPGALMARGMTSPRTSVSPGASAVGVMFWSMVKLGVSIAMLMLAPKWVQPLSWPALLVTMVLCMQVYWIALLKRNRKEEY